MGKGKLTILIEGREALPIRAIPYVTSWQESPDSIVRSLAETTTIKVGKNLEIPNRYSLVAYTMDDRERYEPIPASQWKDRIVAINSLATKLRADERSNAADENHGPWRVAAVLNLPDDVFLWLDEFQSWYTTTRPMLSCDSNADRMSTLLAERERTDLNDQDLDDLEAEIFHAADDSLCMTPILPPEIEGNVWRYVGIVVPVADVEIPSPLLTDAVNPPDAEPGRAGPVWWGVARAEGERWYAENIRSKLQAGDGPVTQGQIADYLYQWLSDKGYRGRSGQKISKSSILEQIVGIASRKKDGMNWR